tara:strand:- start:51 stop:248 length:198 start_codon:yes stop_codon:yes gene_type:complete
MISKNNFADVRINTETLCLAIEEVLRFIEEQNKLGNLSEITGKTLISMEYLKRTKNDEDMSIYYP